MLTAGKKAPSKRFSRDMLLGRSVYYLVDVTYAGRTFHLSRVSLEVKSNATGEVLQYDGIVAGEIEFEEEVSLFSDSADVLSFALQTVLPLQEEGGVAALVARGYDLLQATAELSLWIDGTAYEDRRVLLRGRFAGPEYGWAEDPINTTVQQEAFEDRGLIPAPSLTITTTTWPDAVEGAIGLSYPFCFGENPGTGAIGNAQTTPAYLVRPNATSPGAEVLLVCGHITDATQVRVFSDSDIQTVGLSVITDGLGQSVTVIGPGLGALGFTDDDEFWIDWDVNGGGYPNQERTGPITGAGDLLEYLLLQSTMTVDTGRVAAAKPYLNRFKMTGCILEGVSPFDFITSNLSPILPMSMVNGPYGLYIIPWRYDANQKDVVERIDVDIDPSVELESPVSYEAEIKDIINEFKLRYALRGRDGIMKATITLGADRDPDDPYSAESYYCKASQLRYGKRSEEQESTVIYDDATAGLVVSWWARAKALPTRTVSYSVGYDRAFLERGDVVSITDSNLFFQDQIALVDSIVYREDASLKLTLRIIEDPALKFKNKK